MNRFFKDFGSRITLVSSDVLTIIIAFLLAFLIREILSQFLHIPALISDDPLEYQLSNWWAIPIYITIFIVDGLYNERRPFWQETKTIIRSIFIAALLMYTIVSLGQLSPYVSRIILILHPIVTLLLLPLTRRFTKSLLFSVGLWNRPMIEIQVDTSYTLKDIWGSNTFMGYQVVKTLKTSLNSNKRIDEIDKELIKHIKELKVDTIAVITNDIIDKKLSFLIEKLYFIAPQLLIVPEYMTFDVINADVYHLMYENLFLFDIKKGLISRQNQLIKRVIDLIISVIGILLTFPIMIIVALAIYIADGAPVVYTQERYGKDGKLFRFMKFRSMYKNNEKLLSDYLKEHPDKHKEWEEFQKLKDYDPRVLKGIGNILRKFDLDELPQLFNVLIGAMSIVGPRPYLPRERAMIGSYFNRILAVKPGITGLWQATGRNDFTFKQRLNIDTWYIQNWSLWLDFVIVFKTIKRILF